MNPAKSVLVKKDACSVFLMFQPIPASAHLTHKRSAERDAVAFLPTLSLNSIFFVSRDFNQMFPTATAAVVTAPILNNRQL